ncbi:Diaminopimelate decarboxylase [Apilactobacillus kunkeei]|uniref:diaminopimelate decarboxylase n=1 Tax=Apilactobacillus kunkeei TaxID=148814 RepID=UPI001364139C|nr:diaminopimelate decarboxylase [Apilactobacillus kunkeei]NBI01137.1 diaminopimelate decarboxylase [Apilactobacillus kunkeei]CAI2638052.1 Diaminopimelate decarboxylase [Apilactobacillus kunkeei]CAI2643052.1 Diaminopimelate decarboxylase [Apilactobacillus kunkeei]CAI2648157.1 Diaminopimelate decarboxylase [Apilactobacillus kunkeei]
MTNQITDNDINADGHLQIDGCDAVELAHQFGTPLMVYNVSAIRDQFHQFNKIFEQNDIDYEISYASKAFANTAMYQLVNQEGGHIDVVSGGEIAVALHAGFPAAKMSFHGNNKSLEELRLAIRNHVGVIMVDNFHEIELINQVVEELDETTNVIMRITPGITAHTHEFIQTGQVDSKFGFDLASGQVEEGFELLHKNPRVHVLGFHAHIGSQISSPDGFNALAVKMMQLANKFNTEYDFTTEVLDLGGGFGIQYVSTDGYLAPEKFVESIINTIKEQASQYNLQIPAIWIEPGRSIVGSAGLTLYTVGSQKRVDGIKPYVAVDGGMGDNIRPMLYDAEYEVVSANNPRAQPVEEVRLVGKYCESGDVLIKNASVPSLNAGDVVAVLDTGAYGYSMASNYNLNLKPAIVFVEKGKAQLVTKRQSFENLYELDNNLELGD